MFWANFFHIYQPFDQRPEILDRIVNESYRPLISGWLANPKAKITLNINACLTENLVKFKYYDVIKNLLILSQRGQLEFTASAKFHPFLPILPKKEIIRQIELNEKTNAEIFGKVYAPQGFFPPEMGYSETVGEVVQDLGFKWIVLDEIAFKGKIDQVKYDRLYQLSLRAPNGRGNLYIFFRERRMSNLIMAAMLRTPESLWEAVGGENAKNRYLLTAMDGETFGHHRPGLDKTLLTLYNDKRYKLVTVSELLEFFCDKQEKINPVSCSWASSEKEIAEGKNFYLYYNPDNKLHRLQKELIDLAIKITSGKDTSGVTRRGSPEVEGIKKARLLLDQALSCNHMWWANPDAWWSIEEIEKGAYNLENTILSLRAPSIARGVAISSKKKIASSSLDKLGTPRNDNFTKAEELYQKIMAQAFKWQREGLPQRLHEEKESFKKIPFKDRAKPGEYETLLEVLKKEEEQAIGREEYELAIRWRDSRYKLEKGWDIYDFVHIVDQMRIEGRLGKYEELAAKFREQYKKFVPGQADK